MPNSDTPDTQTESFEQLFNEYERTHSRKPSEGPKQIEGTVLTVTDEAAILDIGFKTEGQLLLADLGGEQVKPGDKLTVTVKGRDPEGYYLLSRFKVARPTDWDSLEKAFREKATIVGTVTQVVKGGLSVDVGVRAFMPASRTGTRDPQEMEKLVEQEIRCRITKLDVSDEDVVVDRRVVLEEESAAASERLYEKVKEGDTVTGTVRSLADYGAFVDIGGIDGLLHVGEIAWGRVAKPEDVLKIGDPVTARVIKFDKEKKRISLSLRQLQSNPWDTVAERYKAGQRIRGTVSRVVEFGAFVDLEPGVEGLIHVSEMSWGKKLRIASDIVKPGETVDAVVLSVNPAERRIALGMKQTLGDPFQDAAVRYAAGSVVEGAVTKLMPFGAFVQIAEGVEGLIHISEITPERRLNHPSEMLKAGQVVRALVLAVDPEKRQFKLSMKQLVPTGLDEYIAEHKSGDVVTGRVTDVKGSDAHVELGEGIGAMCKLSAKAAAEPEQKSEGKADLSSLSSMLSAKWKSGAVSGGPKKAEPIAAGQIRSFKITKLDAEGKKIEVELA